MEFVDEGEISGSKSVTVIKPKQESLMTKYLGGFIEMFTNKTCLFTVLGGMFRFWQGNTISYYTLQYFKGYGN